MLFSRLSVAWWLSHLIISKFEFTSSKQPHLWVKYSQCFFFFPPLMKLRGNLDPVPQWESSPSHLSLLKCINFLCVTRWCWKTRAQIPQTHSPNTLQIQLNLLHSFLFPETLYAEEWQLSGWQTERKWGATWTQSHNVIIIWHMHAKPQLNLDTTTTTFMSNLTLWEEKQHSAIHTCTFSLNCF